MKDNLIRRLLSKADLTDTVPPDFSISPLRRRKIKRDAMRKIRAAEGNAPAAVRPHRRPALLIAAALMLALIIPVSAIGLTHLIWRPDVGLTDLAGNPVAADAGVYASTASADFGPLRLTYVISTEHSGTATLSVWLIGEAGGRLTDLTAEAAGKTYPLAYNGSDGEEGHNYITTECPPAEAVTIRSAALSAEATVTLVKRENAAIFVPEHFGISFELIPEGEEMRVIIIDRGILGAEMSRYARMRLIQGTTWRFYDAEGNLYVSRSGGAGIDDYGRSFMGYQLTREGEQTNVAVPDLSGISLAENGGLLVGAESTAEAAAPVNAADIVRVELDTMIFRYKFNEDIPGGELPIPADGETITGDFVSFAFDGFTDHITAVKREGNTLILTQPKVALDYSGALPVSDTEASQTIRLYAADGSLLGESGRWSADYSGEGSGATMSRTITMHFDDISLDQAASAKIALTDLWIYLDQAWSVDLS